VTSTERNAQDFPIRETLRLYDREPLGIRLFVRARHLLCPFDRILPHVPPSGRVLDVGCGHGLFSHLMAVQSRERAVLGVDPSPTKIAVAQRVGQQLANVSFRLGTIDVVDEDDFQAITIMDVLYLLPPAEKLRLLQRCRELIAPNGVLLLKTNDTRPRWKYWVTRTQEALMTGLGLTHSEHGLHFFSAPANAAVLERAGFRVQIVPLPTRLPYPHVLFVARPRA